MVETGSTPSKTSKARSTATAGYRKGEETRQRILDVALKAFGDASYKSATTRQIAEAAGVSMAPLQNYFGDKEVLSRPCAKAIVERCRRRTQAAAMAAMEALSGDGTAETARLHL